MFGISGARAHSIDTAVARQKGYDGLQRAAAGRLSTDSSRGLELPARAALRLTGRDPSRNGRATGGGRYSLVVTRDTGVTVITNQYLHVSIYISITISESVMTDCDRGCLCVVCVGDW